MKRAAVSRLRMAVVVAVLLATGVACDSGGTKPSTPEDSGHAGRAAKLEPDCPKSTPRREASADLVNKVVSSADLPTWQAADIGASAELSDGQLVWVFGDTVRTADVSPRIVANSMLISTGLCVAQLLPPGDGPVIPDATNGAVHWPMSVTVLPTPHRDLVVVLCSRIQRGDRGPFDFRFIGASAAMFSVEPNGVPILQQVVDITPNNSDPDQINWGAATTLSRRWIYVYGTRLTGEKYVFGRELYVGRAPADDPYNRSHWAFWDGSAWQPDHTKAAPILSAKGGVSQTLSVHAVGDTFLAVSKRDGDLGDFVYTWTAPTAVGPWTARKAVPAPFEVKGDELQYAPLAHPEVPLKSGNLLVSISRNTTDLNRLLKDPQLGRPRFVEVRLP